MQPIENILRNAYQQQAKTLLSLVILDPFSLTNTF